MVDIYPALMPTNVILDGKDIILSPNGWISPTSTSDVRRAFDAQAINHLDSRLMQATKVSLSIDAVIFADGETCGVNAKRLDQAIVARRNAAISLAAKARDAVARGEPAVSSEDLFEQSKDKSSEVFWREAILVVSFPVLRRGTHICAILRVFRGLLRSTPPGYRLTRRSTT